MLKVDTMMPLLYVTQDHFGLEEIKKRLLEYLAVCSLKVRNICWQLLVTSG